MSKGEIPSAAGHLPRPGEPVDVRSLYLVEDGGTREGRTHRAVPLCWARIRQVSFEAYFRRLRRPGDGGRSWSRWCARGGDRHLPDRPVPLQVRRCASVSAAN